MEISRNFALSLCNDFSDNNKTDKYKNTKTNPKRKTISAKTNVNANPDNKKTSERKVFGVRNKRKKSMPTKSNASNRKKPMIVIINLENKFSSQEAEQPPIEKDSGD
ncbi:hypothetical protein NPIL_153811 [Nephila pilipes]|uniref:Uncharacterized protein n=1 Tax=Nephila pilipes TaxID=299642 RepID=A0A8X6Q0M0_NEPPI|nr:hypothetical protein NPIL_153811 [Nephila pilipes]